MVDGLMQKTVAMACKLLERWHANCWRNAKLQHVTSRNIMIAALLPSQQVHLKPAEQGMQGSGDHA